MESEFGSRFIYKQVFYLMNDWKDIQKLQGMQDNSLLWGTVLHILASPAPLVLTHLGPAISPNH